MKAKTKVVATIGPACESRGKIKQMIKAGVDVFRFNMKHGEVSWHESVIRRVREVSKEMECEVAIMIDLHGPEIRVGKLKSEVKLSKGDELWIGKGESVEISPLDVIEYIKEGEEILFDDGRIVAMVAGKGKEKVKIKVLVGGVLKSNKGVNIPELEWDIDKLVDRDLECLGIGNRDEVDWVALSFVGSRKEIELLRGELKKNKFNAGVVAKIERRTALNNLDEIIDSADAVMVGRGDLGVEIKLHEVPFWQKQIISRCREMGRPVITATEMLQSMIENPRPTRAEVSDVANAVYDGTDALMLSGESAVGKYPVKAVEIMKKEAGFCEPRVEYPKVKTIEEEEGQTAAVVEAANSLIGCKVNGKCEFSSVVVLTETGATARYLSRLRPKMPIIAVTSSSKAMRQMKLVWGIMPVRFIYRRESERGIRRIVKYLQGRRLLKRGQKIVIIHGKNWGKPGLTSVVRVQEVE